MNMQLSASPCFHGEKARGFTLVEMLVAVFIAMIVFGVGFTLINGAALARSDAQARIRATDAARIFFDMLERDVAAAYPGPWTTPMTKADLVQPVAGVQTHALAMTTTAESTTATSGFITVRYYVLPGTKILYRETVQDTAGTAVPSLAATPTHDSVFALMPEVEELSAKFYAWNEATRTLDDSDGTPDLATHINVALKIKDPNEKMPVRIFQKSLAIPAAFKN